MLDAGNCVLGEDHPVVVELRNAIKEFDQQLKDASTKFKINQKEQIILKNEKLEC